MSKTITSILKEAAGDALSDETLNSIEEVFTAAVEEKTNLNLEAALIAQDQKHATKLKAVMEAVDKDRAEKLEKVVRVVTENHTKKLKAVINKYETMLNEEAFTFKDDLVGTISDYIDTYIDDKIPVEQLQEAVHNKRAIGVIAQLREALAIDLALAQDSIKGAVIDGKTRLDESVKQAAVLKEENEKLTNELIKTRSEILIEEKCKGLTPEKKRYIKKVLTGKSKTYINENFDYMLQMFDFDENRRNEQLRQEAVQQRKGKDVDVIVENAATSATKQQNQNQQGSQFNDIYMSELERY
jgi:hypothetical protein